MAGQWLPIADIAAQVQAGTSRASDLVEQSLETIADKQEEYKAIIATTPDRARERAEAIDVRVAKGEKVGRLAGVPFIAKDNFLVFGADTTAASNMLKGFNAPYQATAIEKLEAEGAICVAKANLDAFAHGSSTENSDFFTTRNPHDTSRVPGGSSGGSAAAVALEMAPFATGSDTGSSIRLPAAFCGVVGFKPTYGAVSRSGVVAMASSLDVVGPLARTVEDASLVFDVIADKDILDSTTLARDPKGYALPAELGTDLTGTKIGILKEYMDDHTAPAIKATLGQAIEKLKKAGAEISEISIPSMPLSLAVYYVLCPAEVSSNLGRYDGQRYGYNAAETEDLETSYKNSRGRGFGKEAKRRIMIGTYVLSSGYYDAYYKRAQIVRTKLIREFEAAFQKVDFMLGAVSPTGHFKIGEKTHDPLEMYLADLYMTGANLVGIPSISVPAGMADGLPVGLQLLAPQRKDRELLSLARQAEELLI
ncbi:MAG TPA: Asp-tRNA(Asn)/Glu-tRNA(Gln) amidotransferase subunit GatA [Candidatus Saccharimonadales bacterium]|nr:Asp-tRNA(Asn)/Glu-tRNA(Gln) amidotransferase subunit GatA [Candidatus Saccharimonadales bacterium]